MLKLLIVPILLLSSCFENPNPVIDCKITPEHSVCKGHCVAHCTRTCEKWPEECTSEQLEELIEIGYIRDRNSNGEIIQKDSIMDLYAQKMWKINNSKEKKAFVNRIQKHLEDRE